MGVLKFVDDIRDKGERILTFDREAIELSIVLNWLKFTVFFIYEEEGGSEGGL